MIEPKNEFAKILSELEGEIKDPKDLEIAKSKLFELGMLFMDYFTDSLDSKSEINNLNKKIDKIQKSLRKIEEDIYIEEDLDDDEFGDQIHDNDINEEEDFEFEIKCPYCNYEFILGHDEDLKEEIECPKCHKEIQLDWDDYCDGECDHCKSICYSQELESYEKGSSKQEIEYSLREDDEQYNLENKKNSNKREDKHNQKEDLQNQENNENEDDM